MQTVTDFDDWMTEVAALPSPTEERLDELRGGEGIDGLSVPEIEAWLLRVMVEYRREPAGWHAEVMVGRSGPECTGMVEAGGRFAATVTAVMDQAQALADTTRKPVKVIHGVDGTPDKFLPTLRRFAADMSSFTTPVWAAIPAPLPVDASIR